MQEDVLKRRGASGWQAPSPGCAVSVTRHTLCVPHLVGSSPLHSEQLLAPPEPRQGDPGCNWPKACAAPTNLQSDQRCHHWKGPSGILSPVPTPVLRAGVSISEPRSHPGGSPGPAREDRTGRRRLVRKLLRAQCLETPSSRRELSASTLFVFGTSQLPVLERKGIFLMSKKRQRQGGGRQREREEKDKNKSAGRASSHREVLLQKGILINYVHRRPQRVD